MPKIPQVNNGVRPEASIDGGNEEPSLFQVPYGSDLDAKRLSKPPSTLLEPGGDLLENKDSPSSSLGAQEHSCDLCSVMVAECQMHCTDGNAEMCEQCFKQFQALPPGKIRECLERFMLGNVV
jgi:hypothetical protein